MNQRGLADLPSTDNDVDEPPPHSETAAESGCMGADVRHRRMLRSPEAEAAVLAATDVTDECGRASADDVIVRVDAAAPSVSTAVSRGVLWPANHEFVDVGFVHSASDNCDGDPNVRVLVTSDEPTSLADVAGQGKAPDAILLGEPGGPVQGVRLRAERSSSGNGRVHRILVEATDPCGNVGWSSVRVSVPPNGGSGAIDDGQFFDATAVN